MNRFSPQDADRLVGPLSGCDRLVFRGPLRRLSLVEGRQVSLSARKEAGARPIARERGITQGPVGLLTRGAPFVGSDIDRNAAKQRRALGSRSRTGLPSSWEECQPDCGCLKVRLRPGFPCDGPLGLQGREGLARPLDRAGRADERHDHGCAPGAAFVPAPARRAAPLRTDWPPRWDGLAPTVNPRRAARFGDRGPGDSGTPSQRQWATELGLAAPEERRRLSPLRVRPGRTPWAAPPGGACWGGKGGPWAGSPARAPPR